MRKWWIELIGYRFDLEDLPVLLAGGPYEVVEEADQYFLRSDRFDGLDDPSEVRRAAKEVIGLLNGLARAYDAQFQPISLGGFQYEEDGVRWTHS